LELVLANIACRAYNHRIGIFFILNPSRKAFILSSMKPLRVFLCHSSNDKPAVRELYQKLCAEPWIEPWLDEEELYPGQDWNMEIEKAVESADAIIVCLSKGSITKEGYVQRELRTVLDFADYKPEGTLYIIPVRLEECELPRSLRKWQYADYFKGQRERAFQRLLVSLKRRADALGLIVEEIKEEPKKEISAKPFTKLLDPASLSHSPVGRVSNPTEPVAPKKRQAKSLTYGFWGIGLLVLILGGFGLNYLVNIPPVTTVAASPTETATPKPPISQPTKTPIPTPTLGIGSTMTGEKGETLVYVPAGEFTMGNGDSDAPVHTVYLDAYYIDQFEVTNKQYQACVNADTCEPLSSKSSYTHPSYYENPEFDNYPVFYVNWDKANRYCEVWAGGDLPTEAQWEKAARGTEAFTYPWGNVEPNKDLLNYNQIIGDTTQVGSYGSGKSPYNAYDMAGNVREWVNDYYQSDYYSNNASNPQGPLYGEYRVLRGGSWYYYGNYVRSASRYWLVPTDSYLDIGFRCARSP
jgi:formylglycine-generating enzyme required for sulfatase activity